MYLIGRYGNRGKSVVDRWVKDNGKPIVLEVWPSRQKAKVRVYELNVAYNRLRLDRAVREWGRK